MTCALLYTSSQFTPYLYFVKNDAESKLVRKEKLKEDNLHIGRTSADVFTMPEYSAAVDRFSTEMGVKATNIHPIVSDCFEAATKGSASAFSGGAIFIPAFSIWKKEEDVQLNQLRRPARLFGEAQVKKESLLPEERRELTRLLVLPNRAREYLVAEALAALSYRHELSVALITILPSFVFGVVGMSANEMKKNLYKMPQLRRGLNYLCLAACAGDESELAFVFSQNVACGGCYGH